MNKQEAELVDRMEYLLEVAVKKLSIASVERGLYRDVLNKIANKEDCGDYYCGACNCVDDVVDLAKQAIKEATNV